MEKITQILEKLNKFDIFEKNNDSPAVIICKAGDEFQGWFVRITENSKEIPFLDDFQTFKDLRDVIRGTTAFEVAEKLSDKIDSELIKRLPLNSTYKLGEIVTLPGGSKYEVCFKKVK